MKTEEQDRTGLTPEALWDDLNERNWLGKFRLCTEPTNEGPIVSATELKRLLVTVIDIVVLQGRSCEVGIDGHSFTITSHNRRLHLEGSLLENG